LKGNGTVFLNLNRNNNDYSLTDHHIAIFKGATSSSSQYIFGDGFTNSDRFINLLTTGVSQHRNISTYSPSGNWDTGFFGINRFQSSNYQIRFATTTQTSPTRTATTSTTRPLFLFKAGTSTPSDAGISFYSQGTSLNSSNGLEIYQNLVNRLIYHLNAYVT
jgi:hypothetical protein